MNPRIVAIHQAPELDAHARRTLVSCGLWMRAAFVGASAVVIGIIQLFEGGWSPLLALSTVAAGIALAVLGYRRAYLVLSEPEGPVSAESATPAAAHR